MEKIFTEGLRYTQWAEPMPTFIKARLSFKVPDFIDFLNKHANNSGYINVVVKESSKGNIYCELDTWKPVKKEAEAVEEKVDLIDPATGINVADIPF